MKQTLALSKKAHTKICDTFITHFNNYISELNKYNYEISGEAYEDFRPQHERILPIFTNIFKSVANLSEWYRIGNEREAIHEIYEKTLASVKKEITRKKKEITCLKKEQPVRSKLSCYNLWLKECDNILAQLKIFFKIPGEKNNKLS